MTTYYVDKEAYYSGSFETSDLQDRVFETKCFSKCEAANNYDDENAAYRALGALEANHQRLIAELIHRGMIDFLLEEGYIKEITE